MSKEEEEEEEYNSYAGEESYIDPQYKQNLVDFWNGGKKRRKKVKLY